MKQPVLMGDVANADAAELRDIAAWFDRQGKTTNGDFLRHVANRHEVLAGAYATAIARADNTVQEPRERVLAKLLRRAAGKMSYGHWSSDFRAEVEAALRRAPNLNSPTPDVE